MRNSSVGDKTQWPRAVLRATRPSARSTRCRWRWPWPDGEHRGERQLPHGTAGRKCRAMGERSTHGMCEVVKMCPGQHLPHSRGGTDPSFTFILRLRCRPGPLTIGSDGPPTARKAPSDNTDIPGRLVPPLRGRPVAWLPFTRLPASLELGGNGRNSHNRSVDRPILQSIRIRVSIEVSSGSKKGTESYPILPALAKLRSPSQARGIALHGASRARRCRRQRWNVSLEFPTNSVYFSLLRIAFGFRVSQATGRN